MEFFPRDQIQIPINPEYQLNCVRATQPQWENCWHSGLFLCYSLQNPTMEYLISIHPKANKKQWRVCDVPYNLCRMEQKSVRSFVKEFRVGLGVGFWLARIFIISRLCFQFFFLFTFALFCTALLLTSPISFII